MKKNPIKSEVLLVPKLPTLKKYGLNLEDWEKIAVAQSRVCYICQRLPDVGRLAIDHEHVRGWKKMPPEKRKLYVRGLLCTYCNFRLLSKGITLAKARRIAKYLEEYEAKKLNI